MTPTEERIAAELLYARDCERYGLHASAEAARRRAELLRTQTVHLDKQEGTADTAA